MKKLFVLIFFSLNVCGMDEREVWCGRPSEVIDINKKIQERPIEVSCEKQSDKWRIDFKKTDAASTDDVESYEFNYLWCSKWPYWYDSTKPNEPNNTLKKINEIITILGIEAEGILNDYRDAARSFRWETIYGEARKGQESSQQIAQAHADYSIIRKSYIEAYKKTQEKMTQPSRNWPFSRLGWVGGLFGTAFLSLLYVLNPSYWSDATSDVKKATIALLATAGVIGVTVLSYVTSEKYKDKYKKEYQVYKSKCETMEIDLKYYETQKVQHAKAAGLFLKKCVLQDPDFAAEFVWTDKQLKINFWIDVGEWIENKLLPENFNFIEKMNIIKS